MSIKLASSREFLASPGIEDDTIQAHHRLEEYAAEMGFAVLAYEIRENLCFSQVRRINFLA